MIGTGTTGRIFLFIWTLFSASFPLPPSHPQWVSMCQISSVLRQPAEPQFLLRTSLLASDTTVQSFFFLSSIF